jgi:hypothetical protein
VDRLKAGFDHNPNAHKHDSARASFSAKNDISSRFGKNRSGFAATLGSWSF